MRTFIIGIMILMMTAGAFAEQEPVKFNCEEDATVCWVIPDWAYDHDDYVGADSGVSPDMATEGAKSLKVMCDFPGDRWTAVIVECDKNINLSGYEKITADIYLPKGAPRGFIQARFILTVGEWYFVETKDAQKLKPGKWTTIEAKIGGSRFNDRTHWKCENDEKCLLANITDIKKLGIRIEYDANVHKAGKPYSGPLYIDNIEIK